MDVMNVSEAVEEAIIKSRKLKEGIIRGHWRDIVDKLSEKSEPLWIKESVLYVLVEDSMYLHHMSMNKNKYLNKVQDILKKDYVKDIRFKISKIQNLDYSEYMDKHVEEKKNEEFISELKDLTLEEKIDVLRKKAKEREQVLISKGYKKCDICGMMFLGEEDTCKPCSLKDVVDKLLEDKDDNK
ncbi:MAG: DciA family protein [Cetobacterium sp.]